MKKYLFYLSLIFCLCTFSCSNEGDIETEETEENPNSWRIIEVVGKWQLDYTLETNHDGIHVGTEKRLEATEYNYIKYEFNEDNSFTKITVEGDSSENAETKTEYGEYIAHYPEDRDGKWIDFKFENGDLVQRRMDINQRGTNLIIDLGSTTINCNCSHYIYDYEEIYNLEE